MVKTVQENSETIREKDNTTAAALQMTDHRGRHIVTGRNLMTYLNQLHAAYPDRWPLMFWSAWDAQRIEREHRAAVSTGDGEGGA